MRFCVLGSGSDGNCIYVESRDTRVLIDAGLRCKRITERLEEIDVNIADIHGICVTHDHTDHVQGIPVLNNKHVISLYATEGTRASVDCRYAPKTQRAWNVFAPGSTFAIGALTFHAFPVPHDAGDPVGFVVSDGACRLGIATDMGEAPDVVAECLRHCHALILEFNHDRDMLYNSDRPWELKQRIAGRSGHLSNEQACELLARVAWEDLRTLVLAHISDECNNPALAANLADGVVRHCGFADKVKIMDSSVWQRLVVEV